MRSSRINDWRLRTVQKTISFAACNVRTSQCIFRGGVVDQQLMRGIVKDISGSRYTDRYFLITVMANDL